MIIESGRIVSIENDSVWVETIQKTACGSCKAEKGCGQRLINQWDGHTSYIRVLLEGRNVANYQLGDEIQIGVPAEAIVKGSLIIYMIPLLAMVLATTIMHLLFVNEVITIPGGFAGLLLGGLIVHWYSRCNRYNRELQPVVIDDRRALSFYQPDEHQHVAN